MTKVGIYTKKRLKTSLILFQRLFLEIEAAVLPKGLAFFRPLIMLLNRQISSDILLFITMKSIRNIRQQMPSYF